MVYIGAHCATFFARLKVAGTFSNEVSRSICSSAKTIANPAYEPKALPLTPEANESLHSRSGTAPRLLTQSAANTRPFCSQTSLNRLKSFNCPVLVSRCTHHIHSAPLRILP